MESRNKRNCVTCEHFVSAELHNAPPVCWDCTTLTISGRAQYPLWAARVETTQPATAEAGIKFDADKPDWTLLPWKQMATVLQVLTLGAKKYAPDNWKYVPDSPQRYSAALFRHLLAVQDGEWLDPESKLPHLAHVVCNALFLMWHRENKT
jgi:hypothetical protein